VQLLRSRQVRTAVAAAAGLITVIGSLVVGVPAASAATAPPAASQLQVVHRTDHSLTIKFAVPAAYYHPGAGAVVRITRGYTPAATPAAGYSVGSIDSAHEAQAGPNPPLGANLAYTFAVWIRDSGVYSKRATITTATLKDTTAPDSVSYLTSQAALAGGQPRVVLTWQNPCCDTLGPVRIVRNTKPTTTGGTVFNVPAASQAWVDDNLPDSIVNNPGVFDYSTAPLYYYVIPRDAAGHFARYYTGTKIVVASRTISGHVSGSDRYIAVFCCPDDILWQSVLVTSLDGLGDGVNGGAFTVHVPPGVFTICSGDNLHANDPTATCWVATGPASGHTTSWDGFDEGIALPTMDLTSATTYTAVEF
jgi:hypothetical protein